MTPPESTTEWLKEFTWVHASVILSVIVLVILLIVFYLLYKSKPCKGSSIALGLSAEGDCVLLPLLSILSKLSLCPSCHTITNPTMLDNLVS